MDPGIASKSIRYMLQLPKPSSIRLNEHVLSLAPLSVVIDESIDRFTTTGGQFCTATLAICSAYPLFPTLYDRPKNYVVMCWVR